MVRPSIEPQFHIYEIGVGVGSFNKFEYNGFII